MSYLNFTLLLHFFVKPFDLTTMLQQLNPTRKAVLLVQPPNFLRRVGGICSLEFFNL